MRQRISIISIVKYNTYNPLPTGNKDAGKDAGKDADRDSDKDNINKIKKDIKKDMINKPLARSKKKSEPQIIFDFKKRKFLNIKIEDKTGWLDAYPACDIDQELRKMREWLLANPKKKKSNYRQFINNWLSRAQDRGGSKLSHSGSYEDQRKKKLDDWTKKPLEK